MQEGTKSVLFGCHNPIIHGVLVLFTWRIEYKSWPKVWQIICIFIHDIGVWGKPYISDPKSKNGHWKKGAYFAAWLFNLKLLRSFKLENKPFLLIAGHCPSESKYPQSMLFYPDKKSWLIAPTWWLWSNYLIENFKVTTPREWKILVAQNIKSSTPISSHDLFLQAMVKE